MLRVKMEMKARDLSCLRKASLCNSVRHWAVQETRRLWIGYGLRVEFCGKML